MFRITDPESSKKSALEYVLSGAKQERSMQVLYILSQHPYATHGELGNALYNDPKFRTRLGPVSCFESPHKRLPEMEKKGWTKASIRDRYCSVTGKPARVWVITEAGLIELGMLKDKSMHPTTQMDLFEKPKLRLKLIPGSLGVTIRAIAHN